VPKLLVIDDEPNITFTIAEVLGSSQLEILTAGTAREGLELLRQHHPDVVLCDLRLPDQWGLEAFDQMHQIDSRVPVILMTAFARTETAIEAMRRGAFEYVIKPVDYTVLKQLIDRAIEVSRLNHVAAMVGDEEADNDTDDADRLVGLSAPMQEIYKTIGKVAPQDSTVLILGESGTGKELVARAIYHYSLRDQRPFHTVNCAALSESLLESELFGHEKGAFTGADQRRIGKFEQFNGGTIFLDEIGDMSPATQAKALRLIQKQQFDRLGGNTSIETDVRLIAATNQDLAAMVAAGRFREDLFYRLNGFTISLPPLRERLEDIPALVAHFIKVGNRQLNKNVHHASPELLAALQAHPWPGNVRELQSAVRYAMVHAVGDILTPDCLPETCRAKPRAESRTNTSRVSLREETTAQPGTIYHPADAPPAPLPSTPGKAGLDIVEVTRRLLADGQTDLYHHLIPAVDFAILEETMRHFAGNQVQAAVRLGISRMTLRSKLRSLGMLNDKSEGPDSVRE
jgi:DNA-binding NtrC family response regulator